MNIKYYNKIMKGALCALLSGTLFLSTAYADGIPIAGISAVLQDSGIKSEMPISAAESLAQVAIELSSAVTAEEADAEQPAETVEPEIQATETEAGEHPAVLAADARQNAEENSVFNNIAISQVKTYVNIRTEAGEDGEVAGKIYNNCLADINDRQEVDGELWYKVSSGSVEGYIKAAYFVTGDEARRVATELGGVVATITTSSLRLRESPDLGSGTVTVLTGDQPYTVEEQQEEFTRISIDGELTGYVQNDYIEIEVALGEAMSLEEEQQKLEEEARREAELRALEEEDEEDEEDYDEYDYDEDDYDEDDYDYREGDHDDSDDEYDEDDEPETTVKETTEEETTEEKTTEEETTEEETTEEETTEEETTEEETTEEETTEEETTEKETTEEETTKKETTEAEDDDDEESSKKVSKLRRKIVDTAWSYVGEIPYVWGGNSLKTGVDCSGFVQQIFKKYGISLPRASDEQGYCGEKVSIKEALPGDIVYYGGHIGIYVGDGTVVHASCERDGIKYSSWNYRSVISIRNVIDY